MERGIKWGISTANGSIHFRTQKYYTSYHWNIGDGTKHQWQDNPLPVEPSLLMRDPLDLLDNLLYFLILRAIKYLLIILPHLIDGDGDISPGSC